MAEGMKLSQRKVCRMYILPGTFADEPAQKVDLGGVTISIYLNMNLSTLMGFMLFLFDTLPLDSKKEGVLNKTMNFGPDQTLAHSGKVSITCLLSGTWNLTFMESTTNQWEWARPSV